MSAVADIWSRRDLFAALDDGQLSVALLDVVYPEPLPTGQAIWHRRASC